MDVVLLASLAGCVEGLGCVYVHTAHQLQPRVDATVPEAGSGGGSCGLGPRRRDPTSGGRGQGDRRVVCDRRPRGPGRRVQQDGGRAVAQSRAAERGPLGARRRPLLQPRSVSFFSSTFSVTLTSRCFAFKDSDR